MVGGVKQTGSRRANRSDTGAGRSSWEENNVAKTAPSTDEQLRAIAWLVGVRDDLDRADRIFAGKANAQGFGMTGQENIRKWIDRSNWLLVELNPASVSVKLLTGILQRLRAKKRTTPLQKRILLAIEAHVFWGKMALSYLEGGPTPVFAVKTAASVLMKALTIRSLAREEALRRAMEEYAFWSRQYRSLCRQVIRELNAEIAALR